MKAFDDAMDQYSLADLATVNAGEQVVHLHRSFAAASIPAAVPD